MPRIDVHVSEYIEVDVDLDEFDTDDLLKELRERKVPLPFRVADSDEVNELAEKFRVALYQSDDKKIIETAKSYFDVVHDIRC